MIQNLCRHLNTMGAQSSIGVDRVKQVGAFQISVGVRLRPRATKMQALAELIEELNKFNFYVESLDTGWEGLLPSHPVSYQGGPMNNLARLLEAIEEDPSILEASVVARAKVGLEGGDPCSMGVLL